LKLSIGISSIDDVGAAERVIARIVQAIIMLEQFPMLGRVGRVPGTRELSIVRLPYFAVYRIASETEINVLAVIHERQKFPKL
jgi:toxin ParE1/3/4